MPRPCLICSDNAKLAKAAELIGLGTSDRAVANVLSTMTPCAPSLSEMAVSRHRRNHIMKVAQDRLAILSKGAVPSKERQQLSQAAAADTPTPQQFVEAYFGLKAQAEKIQRIEDRLERVAQVAENAGSPTAAATVAAQQLRAVETGSKLVGAGGYSTPKVCVGEGATFNLTIQFGDHERRISATTVVDPGNAAPAGPTIVGTISAPMLVGAEIPELVDDADGGDAEFEEEDA